MPATTRRPAGGQLGELCIYDDGDSLISGQALVASYHTEVSGVSFDQAQVPLGMLASA